MLNTIRFVDTYSPDKTAIDPGSWSNNLSASLLVYDLLKNALEALSVVQVSTEESQV